MCLENVLSRKDQPTMAEEIQAFLENGDLNSESFFIDEDAPPSTCASATATPADATATTAISVGGIFSFYIAHTSPFTIKLLGTLTAKSRALRSFEAKLEGLSAASITDRLKQVTRAYLDISDSLDEEQAAAMDDDEDDENEAITPQRDLLDELNEQSLALRSDEVRRKLIEMNAQFEERAKGFELGQLPKPMVDRLLSDYHKIIEGGEHHGWVAGPVDRDLTTWNLCFKDFDKGGRIENTIAEWVKKDPDNRKPQIDLLMKFPKDYPFAPPFVRVLRPRIHGGLIINGAICTELLTPDGWRPIFEVESIIETIREQVTCDKTHAQIDVNTTADYTEAEARAGFDSLVQIHKQSGWSNDLR